MKTLGVLLSLIIFTLIGTIGNESNADSTGVHSILLDAHSAYLKDDFKTAMREFKKCAEEGDFDCYFYIGRMYSLGQGVSKDYKEALKWFKPAAERGVQYAHYYIGFLYYNGQGVSRDYREALKWFKLEAETWDLKEALRGIGIIYALGYGVAKDTEEALKWLKRAAYKGDVEAHYNIGVIYHDRKNYKEALKWYEFAAKSGYSDAQYNLEMAQKQLSEQTPVDSELETKSSSSSDTFKAQLKELKELLDEGLITEEEAAAKRAKLLKDL